MSSPWPSSTAETSETFLSSKSLRILSMASPGVWIDRKTTPRGSNFSRSRSRTGSDVTHRPHQMPQKLQEDDLAPKSARDRALPSVQPRTRHSGAGCQPSGVVRRRGLCRGGRRLRRGGRAELNLEILSLAVHDVISRRGERAEGERRLRTTPLLKFGTVNRPSGPDLVRPSALRPAPRGLDHWHPPLAGPRGRPPSRSGKHPAASGWGRAT